MSKAWVLLKIFRKSVDLSKKHPASIKSLGIIVKQLEKPHAKHYQKTYEKEGFYAISFKPTPKFFDRIELWRIGREKN